ncbi:phytoene desaturase family protein [Chloroflexota bacterium]
MAKNEHDVVVIGAGHNGLVVAAYLARAGLDVCVVERQDIVGGAVATREVTGPGFKQEIGAIMHIMIQTNPLIRNDELGLISKYGLKYIEHDPQLAVVYPDQRALIFYKDMDKTCESIAQFSKKDAEVYPKFCKEMSEIARVADVSRFSPPPPFGRLFSILDQSEEGQEYIRVMLSSCQDIAQEWFESEQMINAVTRFASEAQIGPGQKGTGVYALATILFHESPAGIPLGGSGQLSEALAACIRDDGGQIRLSSPVKAIKVEKGEAKRVVLENGEEIAAKKAIISNLNVKQLFLQMLEPEVLPPDFPQRVKRIAPSSFSTMLQAFALNEAPKFKAGGDVNKSVIVQTNPWMEDYLRSFEELTYGIPQVSMLWTGIATVADPSRAPEGKHTLYLSQYQPYNLKEGGAAAWDEIRQKVADDVLDEFRRFTTNMGPENILGRWIASPLDLERYNPALVEGDYHHIGAFPTQWLSNRPLAGWGNYRTPVEKLYMCGASTHPGGGVSGGGRAAVEVIMEDLGIDFDKVVGK